MEDSADADAIVRMGDRPIGVIARRKGLQKSDRMIHVILRGEVVIPGSYELPEGTTILEAINKAGGFTGVALTREIQVSVSEQKYKIPLQRQKRLGKASLIWYGKREVAEDFVLPGPAQIRVAPSLFLLGS